MDMDKKFAWDDLNSTLRSIMNRSDMKDRETRLKAAIMLYELHFKPQDTENSIDREIVAQVVANQLSLILFFQHANIKDEPELKDKVQKLIASLEEDGQEDAVTAHNRRIAGHLRGIFERILRDQRENPVGF